KPQVPASEPWGIAKALIRIGLGDAMHRHVSARHVIAATVRKIEIAMVIDRNVFPINELSGNEECANGFATLIHRKEEPISAVIVRPEDARITAAGDQPGTFGESKVLYGPDLGDRICFRVSLRLEGEYKEGGYGDWAHHSKSSTMWCSSRMVPSAKRSCERARLYSSFAWTSAACEVARSRWSTSTLITVVLPPASFS